MFGVTGTMTPPVKKHTETQFKKRLKNLIFRTTKNTALEKHQKNSKQARP